MDVWEMIWHCGASMVVLLCQLEENEKVCDCAILVLRCSANVTIFTQYVSDRPCVCLFYIVIVGSLLVLQLSCNVIAFCAEALALFRYIACFLLQMQDSR